MGLLFAIAPGLPAGPIPAWVTKSPLQIPDLHPIWVVPGAFLPQFPAAFLPATRRLTPDDIAAAALVFSQVLLLVFAWANRKKPGFWMLGFGLLLNLIVIAFNGGLMPISPEIIRVLFPDAPPAAEIIGLRMGKNVILPVSEMRWWWLSDRFLLPDWFPPNHVAYSIGDVFIAAGAFWLLWSLGGQAHAHQSIINGGKDGYDDLSHQQRIEWTGN